MHSEWQLQEAKGNFSQFVKRAAGGDAQVTTVHGKPTAVMISAEEYARLTRRRGFRQLGKFPVLCQPSPLQTG